MSEPKIVLLALMEMATSTPPETTCLFTDGVEHWTGWYDNGDIYIKTPNGSYPVLPASRVTHWAKLNNTCRILEGASK